MEGRQLIAELIQQAAGQIVIMPGGGVNAANIAALAQATGASQFHSSGRHTVPSRMQWRRPHIYMGAWQQSEYTHSFVDPQRIQQMVAALA